MNIEYDIYNTTTLHSLVLQNIIVVSEQIILMEGRGGD